MNKSNLGQASLSIAVKDISKSLDFYGKLGFEVIEGGHMNEGFPDGEHTKWRILRSRETVIGLFQGMFEKNILTFNPLDVRSIQKELKSKGVILDKECDESTTGPASIIMTDPDGNQIMLDQH